MLSVTSVGIMGVRLYFSPQRHDARARNRWRAEENGMREWRPLHNPCLYCTVLILELISPLLYNLYPCHFPFICCTTYTLPNPSPSLPLILDGSLCAIHALIVTVGSRCRNANAQRHLINDCQPLAATSRDGRGVGTERGLNHFKPASCLFLSYFGIFHSGMAITPPLCY